MTKKETTKYHSKEDLSKLNATIADELKKLGLEQVDEDEGTDEDDRRYHVYQFDTGAISFELYTIDDTYPSLLTLDHSIAEQIGASLSEEATQVSFDDLSDEFPIDPEDNSTAAAGLIALSNMDNNEKEELNYRISDILNDDNTSSKKVFYENIIYSFRIMYALFPAEDSHNIHRTKNGFLSIQSTAKKSMNFIEYVFSDLNMKDTEKIMSEGPIL